MSCCPSIWKVEGSVFFGRKMLTATSANAGTFNSAASLSMGAPAGILTDGLSSKCQRTIRSWDDAPVFLYERDVRAANCKRRGSKLVRESNAKSLSCDRRSNHHADGLILKGWQPEASPEMRAELELRYSMRLPNVREPSHPARRRRGQHGCDEERGNGFSTYLFST